MTFATALDTCNTVTLQALGKVVTVAGQSVQAVFDNGFSLGSVGIGMAGTQPTLRMLTADLPADPVGQTAVVGAVNYLIAAHEPDGTGLSLLMLERA
jgi:hypothetical protein